MDHLKKKNQLILNLTAAACLKNVVTEEQKAREVTGPKLEEQLIMLTDNRPVIWLGIKRAS